jgi:branched-chain amino acid aminotransferase
LIPWDDDELAKIISRTLAVVELAEAVVRLTVSRGVSLHRGLLPEQDLTPTLVVYAVRFQGYPAPLYQRGMHTIVSRIRRNEQSPLATIKSLNYLDNILARREAAAQGADEALLLNTNGNVSGASAANLFLVDGERLLTPPLSDGALPGTVREAVIDLMVDQIDERPITLKDVDACQECFLTSALLALAVSQSKFSRNSATLPMSQRRSEVYTLPATYHTRLQYHVASRATSMRYTIGQSVMRKRAEV